jgi:uncharacterized membrane protein
MESTDSYRTRPFLIRSPKLVLPFAIVAAQVVFLYFFLDQTSFLIIIGLMTTYVLPPAGKETVIPVGIALGIPWWLIAASIMMIDVETALFMGWNFELALQIPGVGRIMESFIEKTREFITEQPRLKRLYFTGIVLLVMVPVMGSGGIRGSIIGQLLGMQKRPVFLAIVLGAFIGCFGIALGTLFLEELFIRSILIGTAAVAGLIIIALAGWLWTKVYRNSTRQQSGKK